MSKIVKIIGREIIDSRGQVLLLVPVKLWNCAMATNPVSWVKA